MTSFLLIRGIDYSTVYTPLQFIVIVEKCTPHRDCSERACLKTGTLASYPPLVWGDTDFGPRLLENATRALVVVSKQFQRCTQVTSTNEIFMDIMPTCKGDESLCVGHAFHKNGYRGDKNTDCTGACVYYCQVVTNVSGVRSDLDVGLKMT